MRRILCFAVVGVSLAMVAANFNISMPQAITQGVLNELRLEIQPDNSGRIGGPAKFKVTDKTIEHLRELEKNGKHVIAHPDGSITIE